VGSGSNSVAPFSVVMAEFRVSGRVVESGSNSVAPFSVVTAEFRVSGRAHGDDARARLSQRPLAL
jgi:hypothetical protein